MLVLWLDELKRFWSPNLVALLQHNISVPMAGLLGHASAWDEIIELTNEV